MSDRAKRVDEDLAAAVRKRYFEISETERRGDDQPAAQLAAKKEAKKWKEAFDAEQALFVSYRATKCDNVVNFENAGGSNAGGAASKCFIRLTLQRIYDLDVGF